MAPQLVEQLKEWKMVCLPNTFDLVFPSWEKTPINANNLFNRAFDPVLKRTRLPKIKFHDLRHTFASLLITQGEHPKYIQTQM
jgi:integrase